MESIPSHSERLQPDSWYTPLTRVTPLSRYFAMALFIALPFVGFWLGVGYGKSIDRTQIASKMSAEDVINQSVSMPGTTFAHESKTQRETHNNSTELATGSSSVVWLRYVDDKLNLSFEYPSHYQLGKDNSGNIRLSYSPEGGEGIEDQAFIRISRFSDRNFKALRIEELYDEDFALRGYSSVAEREVLHIGGHTAVRMEIPHIGTEVALYIADGTDVIDVAYNYVAPQYVSDYENIVRSLCFEAKATNNSCWTHYSVHEPGIDDKIDSFDIMTPPSWAYPDPGTNGPWVLQSTAFESNIHGLGIPERGGMWVRIHSTSCDPAHSFDGGEYVSVADEGDKYAPFVEKVMCSGGYEVAAGLWSDDLDFTAHRQVLDEVLASFSVGASVVL